MATTQTHQGKKIALVTGANKGIGFEAARQLATQGYKVLLGARDAAKGKRAAEELAGKGLDAEFVEIDVANDDSVARAAREVEGRYGALHALVNNAGVFLDEGRDARAFRDAPLETVRATFETNTLGPLRVTRAFAPLLERSNGGRVVNVSSGMGQLSEMNGGSVAYRLSKTALNALTRITHDELSPKGIKVNSACPGWVRTDMGGMQAPRDVSQGADTLVWLATLPEDGPSGGFFRDRKPIAW